MNANISWALFLAFLGFLLLFAGAVGYELALRGASRPGAWTYIIMIIGAVIVVISFALMAYLFVQNTT